MPASRLESAILHVMHDAPVAVSRLESAILHVMHGAPAQASRLESAILHVMHDATPAPSGSPGSLAGLSLTGSDFLRWLDGE